MKWTAKRPDPPSQWGDKRTLRRFAFIPRLVDMDDDQPTWVWLERYYDYQEFSHTGYGYDWQTVARYSAMPV